MILERRYGPGDRIDPKVIAQEHKISLMPVRNALQQLTTQGLVVTIQRVGFFVREFSRRELLEINDTRKMFELHCLDRYFDNLDPSETAVLLEKLTSTPATQVKTLQSLDGRVHHFIVQASRNAFLIQQYDTLRCLFNMGIYYAMEYLAVARDEHADIVRAIHERKKDKALVCLARHLERVKDEIIQYSKSR